ncbi:MAG: SIMPL domain-containing protein [Lysobacter sp.]|nr:SIMPL domain-containing protein [Lysobacter sp.]
MRTALFSLLLLAMPCFAGTPLPDAPHVMASGEGKMTVAPDLATVSLQASYRNTNAAAAKQAVDRGIAGLLKVAPEFGLGEKDVTASDLSLAEDVGYDDHERRVSRGFLAKRAVTLKLHRLDRLGALLDAAVAAGVNEVDDVSFESSRKDELRLQARAKAVADAREKASGLATAFGATLGPIYSINSLNSSYASGYGSPTSLDRIEVTGTRINTGRYLQPTVDYTERVSAVFELKRP